MYLINFILMLMKILSLTVNIVLCSCLSCYFLITEFRAYFLFDNGCVYSRVVSVLVLLIKCRANLIVFYNFNTITTLVDIARYFWSCAVTNFETLLPGCSDNVSVYFLGDKCVCCRHHDSLLSVTLRVRSPLA